MPQAEESNSEVVFLLVVVLAGDSGYVGSSPITLLVQEPVVLRCLGKRTAAPSGISVHQRRPATVEFSLWRFFFLHERVVCGRRGLDAQLPAKRFQVGSIPTGVYSLPTASSDYVL